MSKQEQFAAVLGRIDTATNGVADELKALKDTVKGFGLTAEQEDAILTQLEASASKLEGIGKTDDPAGDGTGGSTSETPDTGAGSDTETSGDAGDTTTDSGIDTANTEQALP